MLHVLPESGRKHRRSSGSILFSVAVHTVLIGGIVAATTSGSAPPATAVKSVQPLVFAAPPVEQAAAKTSEPAVASRPSGETAPLSSLATPILNLTFTPPALPPIDSRMEGVFQTLNVNRSVVGTTTITERGSAGSMGIVAYADKPALAKADNPVPRYPESLRFSRSQGSVRVRFVIDANGRVSLPSVTILTATHPLFEAAVREVLPKLRFLPAEAGDRAVAVLVEQTFEFNITP